MGLKEIARELNKKGVPTASSSKWYGRTFKYTLENHLYKGMAHYKNNKVKNNVVLDISVARIGLGCIFIGIIFQIIAVFIYCDMILYFKAFCL